ncbi:MAG: hypothetical protein MI754_07970, partial [Chromatiales bacterium]|nr:hypothetical protein [Chromatiales bacterium]
KSRNNIEDARDLVSRFASKDMNFAIQAKARVDQMRNQVLTMNELINNNLVQLAGIVQEVDDTVGTAVRSLQFEDLLNQLVTYSENHVGMVKQMITALDDESNTAATEPQDIVAKIRRIRRRVADIAETHKSAARKPVEQDSMDVGEVELF